MVAETPDEVKKSWRQIHKDKIKEYNRKFRENNKEYFKNYMKQRRMKEKEKALDIAFKLLFGEE